MQVMLENSRHDLEQQHGSSYHQHEIYENAVRRALLTDELTDRALLHLMREAEKEGIHIQAGAQSFRAWILDSEYVQNRNMDKVSRFALAITRIVVPLDLHPESFILSVDQQGVVVESVVVDGAVLIDKAIPTALHKVSAYYEKQVMPDEKRAVVKGLISGFSHDAIMDGKSGSAKIPNVVTEYRFTEDGTDIILHGCNSAQVAYIEAAIGKIMDVRMMVPE